LLLLLLLLLLASPLIKAPVARRPPESRLGQVQAGANEPADPNGR